ncbi:MAG: hypothetical protein WA020_07545 [Candidatus Acidiferrales bacterium]
MKPAGVFLALLLVSGFAARADELHLKDGTKITGTIVGYQGTSFRVKTNYGYALVDRASVVSITVSNPEAQPSAPDKAAEHKAAPAETKAGASKADAAAKVAPTSSPTEKAVNVANATSATAAATPQNQTQETAASTANASAAASAQKTPPTLAAAGAPSTSASAATPTAAPVSAALPDPAPAPIPVREEVQDNLYINETYGFHIYKPPDWELIDGARAALPGAIAALGTADQSTYLLVGLDTSSDTLMAHVAETNERLGESFDGFEPGPLRQTTVAGLHAYEYQFQGVANNQSWAGTVVLFSRGENIFTIFGVTAANSDLVQIQENVISRAIASLQFTKPQ